MIHLSLRRYSQTGFTRNLILLLSARKAISSTSVKHESSSDENVAILNL